MKKNLYSNWREDLREVVDTISSKPEQDEKSEKEIKDKKVNNKVQINPIMKEEFEELGGFLLEFAELDEKMNLKTADMGDVVKDFYKSDAPQFKGKSKKKRQQMAIAAKLTAERGGKKLGEESAVDLVTDMIRKQQGGTYSELKKKGKLSQPRTQRKPSNTKPTDMTKATDPRPGSRYRGD